MDSRKSMQQSLLFFLGYIGIPFLDGMVIMKIRLFPTRQSRYNVTSQNHGKQIEIQV